MTETKKSTKKEVQQTTHVESPISIVELWRKAGKTRNECRTNELLESIVNKIGLN